jgi:putative ABC transport system permease protein
MTSFVEELRLALRRLTREPGFSTTAIVTVAIGIGIAASVFALVDGVLIRPLPYPDSDRLVAVSHAAPGIELTHDGVSAGVFLHYRDGNRVFDEFGAYQSMSFTITDGGSAERVRSAMVTPELFDVLRAAPLVGRLPDASDWNYDFATTTGTTGALLSHELWTRRYDADADVVGRTIEIDGEPFATVVGVAQPGFGFPDPATQLWLVYPQELYGGGQAMVREAMLLAAVGRLRPGVTLEQAETDLNRLVHLMPDAFPDITAQDIGSFGLRAEVRPFKDAIVGDVRLTLLLVLGSAGFLLLVTWANVANLLLTRTHGRRVEIGITRALGATEGNVASRLLSESLLLTLTGALLGLGLAWFAVSARFGFAPRQLPRLDEVGVNGVVITLVAMLAIMSGTLMGAICLASTRQGVAGPALSALRSRSSTQGREGQTGRRILVASQLAMALTLLVGTGLMARTFWQLQQVDVGFRTDRNLTFYLPVTHLGLRADYNDVARLHADVMSRLREVPGVDAVEAATTSVFPLTLPEQDQVAIVAPIDAATGSEGWPLAHFGFATPGYFQTMGIPLVDGRPFRHEDTSGDGPGVIISRSLARDLFGDTDPIGRAVRFVDRRSASLTVVGVAGDVPGTTMRDGGSRAIYLPHLYPAAAASVTGMLYSFLPRYETYVVRTDRDHTALLSELRQAVQSVDARLPLLDVASLDATVAAATAQERFALRLLTVSAAAALFLSIVGIYGVLAYSVRRRTAEIGVRLALGATPGRVTRLVVLQGALISAAGIAVGLAGALMLTRLIGSLLYGTSPTDTATFAAMTLLLFSVALAASYIPARRASRIDPAHALRAND